MEQDNFNQEPNPETDIHSALGEITEEKQAGSNTGSSWDFDKDLGGSTTTPQTEPEPDPVKEEPKTNRGADAKYKATATTGTMIFDGLLLQGLGGFFCKRQFKSRFTPEETKVIDAHNLEDKDLEEVDQELRDTKRKLDRLANKLTKKVKQLPLDKDEKDAVYNSLYEYAKITGMDLSPLLMLLSTMGSIAAHRISVIAQD